MKNRKPVPKVKINSHVAETLKRESRVCQIREKINHYQDSKVEIPKMWNWDLEITPRSLLVGNSIKGLKKDPRHLRL